MECEGKQLQEAATNVIETRPILLSTSRESTISGKVSALGIISTLHFSRTIFIHSMEFAQQLIISLSPHKCVLTALKPLPVLIARCTRCGSILSFIPWFKLFSFVVNFLSYTAIPKDKVKNILNHG